MNSNEISQELDQLADLYSRLEKLQKEQQKAIDTIIPRDVKEKIADIQTEMAPKFKFLLSRIASLEQMIRREVLFLEQSVTGKTKKAIYQKPKTTWDGKKLLALAQRFYQIHTAKKTGKPTVRIIDV